MHGEIGTQKSSKAYRRSMYGMSRAMAGHHCALNLSLLILVLFAPAVFAARDPFPARPAGRQQGPYYGYGFPPGGFFGGPGNGGFYGGGPGNGGFYGGGSGIPPGGGMGGVKVPTVVCQEKGPCYGKEVTCPSKCFWSYSRSGNGYGAGGGGGSCSVDCKYKCSASC